MRWDEEMGGEEEEGKPAEGYGGAKGFISFSLISSPKMWSLNSHK